MKTIRFYRGQLDPLHDLPCDPNNKALTIKQFVSLPLESQSQIINAMRANNGDRGVTNPDSTYVPPFCRHGITLPELEKLYQQSTATIEKGIKEHKKVEQFKKSLASRAADGAEGVSA